MDPEEYEMFPRNHMKIFKKVVVVDVQFLNS